MPEGDRDNGFDRLAVFDRDALPASAVGEGDVAAAPVESLALPPGSPALAPLGVSSEVAALPLPA